MRRLTRKSNRGAGLPPLSLRLLAITASAVVASPCLADVIEIASDGGAVTYASPAVFTPTGVAVIDRFKSVPIPAAAHTVDLGKVIADASVRHQISADLVTEVAWQESRFRQSAVSTRDAVGVMQLMPGTARDLGVNRYDVTQNVHGGAAYLRRMMDRYDGDVRLTLAAYNAGPGAVDRYRGVPPFRETRDYVAAILSRLAQRSLANVAVSNLVR